MTSAMLSSPQDGPLYLSRETLQMHHRWFHSLCVCTLVETWLSTWGCHGLPSVPGLLTAQKPYNHLSLYLGLRPKVSPDLDAPMQRIVAT